MQKQIKYTSEFKQEAVKLLLSSNEPTSVIAKELGINKSTLHKWKRKSMLDRTHNDSLNKHYSSNSLQYKELEMENKELKKKLKRAEEEREILKKAAAYFANQER